MHKTMKYEIIKPLDTSWKVMGDVLRDLRYDTFKAMNKSIQICWEFDSFGFDLKTKTGLYPKKQEIRNLCGYNGAEGYMYNILKDEFTLFNKTNFTQTIQHASKLWKSSKYDISRGKKSIPSYKYNSPIFLNPNNIRNVAQNDKGYEVTISLVSMDKLKELGRKPGGFKVALIAKDNTQKTILNRIISGTYKICGSKITHNKRKNKWMLNLSYSFDTKEDNNLVEDNIMGVDVGIVIPFYIAFNNSLARYHIAGGEIDSFRARVEARRRALLKQGKYCGDGRRGHGRQTRIKPIDKISKIIRNFRDTTNHKYSKYIVDMAIRHRCATIQIEDLSNIAQDSNNKFLKNWTYADLQNKLNYKAEEAGIKVVKINPYKTSQRCSHCGYISRDNRQSQAQFVCLECNAKENADYNAARNISTLGIEEIIKEQLKDQKQEIAKEA